MDKTVHVDLREFPADTHQIVQDWYRWQEAILRNMGKAPGQTVIPNASPEYSFWLANTPKMDGDTLVLNIGDLSWYLVPRSSGWGLQKRERNDRIHVAEFRQFSDAEKYLLCAMGDTAYTGRYKQSPRFRWYRSGLAPDVTLRPVDPAAEYSDQYVLLAGEDEARASMDTGDATWFSHALQLTYNQIETTYRQGLPADWFTIDVCSS